MSKETGGLGGNGPDFSKGFSLAFEFAGAVLLFWLIGRFVDNRFDIEPWGQVVGAVIGWVGGFLHVYYKSKGIGWQTVPGTRRPAPEPVKKEGWARRNKRDTSKGVAENESESVGFAEYGVGGAAGVAGVAENGSGEATGVAENASEAGGVAEDGTGKTGRDEDGARETSGVVEAYLAAVARDESKSRVKGDTQ